MGDDNQVINPGQVWQSKKSDRRILLTGKGINKFKEVYYLASQILTHEDKLVLKQLHNPIYENDLLEDYEKTDFSGNFHFKG